MDSWKSSKHPKGPPSKKTRLSNFEALDTTQPNSSIVQSSAEAAAPVPDTSQDSLSLWLSKLDESDPSPLIPQQEQTEHQNRFQELKELCKNGYRQRLPLNPQFVEENDPANYLALAIEANDLEAIHFCKQSVDMRCSTAYLQKVLFDLIFKENIIMLDLLGKSFPDVYSAFMVYYQPYAFYSGMNLARVAVEKKAEQSALTMFKYIPVTVIGDFWNHLHNMRKFIMRAIASRSIRLRPAVDELGIDQRILTDIFFNCVNVGNVPALDYFIEQTEFPLTTMYTDANGMSFSAMYVAVNTGNQELTSYLGSRCPELFITPTSLGMLPIHVVALKEDVRMLKLFDQLANNTFTAEVNVRGVKLTPFSIAIRNSKLNIADAILAFLVDAEAIQNEMSKLTSWGIIDDNPVLLRAAFACDTFTRDIHINGSAFNLLEMALIGSIYPEIDGTKKHSSIKCLEFLCADWVQQHKSFLVTHGFVRGSILGLLLPNDIPAFYALVKIGKIDPNEPIYEYQPDGTIHRTTFLNRIVEQGSTDLVPIAIKYNADPRIVDDNGETVLEVAIRTENDFVIKYMNSLYE